jgi:short-subunit dehydrogenase
MGAEVHRLQLDLADTDGVDQLVGQVRGLGRPVDALLANAGQGLGHGFLDQDFDEPAGRGAFFRRSAPGPSKVKARAARRA